MGWGKKVIFMGNCFAWKSDFFQGDGEGVGSAVTAGREGPDLGLFQGRIEEQTIITLFWYSLSVRPWFASLNSKLS